MATMPQHLKGLSEELARRPLCFRVVALLALSCLCFYIGKRWASRYDEIAMYSGASSPALSYSSSSHEGHVTLVTDLRGEEEEQGKEQMQQSDTPVRPPPPPPPPPNVVLSPSGVLHEDGSIITKEFPLDEQASIEGDDATSGSSSSSSSSIEETSKGSNSQALKPIRFDVCPPSMKEYIPCLDNVAEINKLPSTQRGEKWERHCPRKEVSCIIPAPTGYKFPIRWPRSRDEVWYKNVPHTKLVEDKGGQNWIAIKKDKFIFPGGGTQFAHGADQYLDQMAKMVPEIAFGVHTRVALDVGCGVASWGAYLMSRDVLPLSIAPKDVHENQIQFALERGVPAMVGVFATRRLLYPSEAFDLIHCSRCRIEWTRDGGVLLLEVDRLLRPGGFFAWAAQPVYKHEGSLPEEWKSMANLSESLCWTLVAKEGYIAIWQKPSNNTCYKNRSVGSELPLCSIDNDPDDVWYAPMTRCITGLREVNHDNKITDWPMRLHIPPARLQSLRNDANTAKEEAFFADQHFWKEIAGGYLRGLGLKVDEVRNVMDMNAGYAGFAAALVDLKVSWWVMNIVPVNGINTLPVIYDRGLLGVAHDWCEAFDTYPRTYDLLHASGLFTLTKDRCSVARIVVEMDRILRPGGTALIRDLLDTIKEVEQVAKAVKWQTRLLDTESGPYGKDRLLQCKKVLWHAD